MKKNYVREKRVICGSNYMEVDLYSITYREYTRAAKREYSSLAQRKLNEKNAKRYLVQLVNTNFTEDDYRIDLTYRDKYLPKTLEQAEECLKRYLRRINYRCSKLRLSKCKYIAVTEENRTHHHLIISCSLPLKELMCIWSVGRGKVKDRIGIVKIEPLNFIDETLEGLCKYLMKNPCKRRRWGQSRGLKQPRRPRPNDNKYTHHGLARIVNTNAAFDDTFWRKKYKGWTPIYTTVDYNDFTGWNVCIKMRRLH